MMDVDIKQLNEQQKKAVTSKSDKILILAGAGSGKTSTLTHRIGYLIKNKKIKPANILAVTFTNKAAKEMKERLIGLLKSGLENMWIGTFHSIFARLIRIEASNLGISSDFSIYDSDDQVRALKKVMSNLNIPQQLHLPNRFQSRISRAKNNFQFPDDLDDSSIDNFEELLPEVYREYQSYLSKNNALDFDDLLLKPIELFQNHPKTLEKYRSKFKYIFIDEYQDTNKAQYLVIKMLVGEKGKICVVGDEDQSIYKWRGADINNILNFPKEYPESELYRLEENYRSNSNILKGSNALVANNTERIGKNLWTQKDDGDKILLMETEDEMDEAKNILEQIHHQMFTKKRSFKDIAILYRTNAQSRAIEDELRRNAISYSIISGIKFYDRKEVKDILAYLKVICNTRDAVNLKRIINFPLRGIGETTVGKIEKYAESLDTTLFEALGHVKEIPSISAGMANRVVEFHELMQKYRALKDEISAAELTSTLATESGIINYLKTEYDQLESESRLDNVYELFNTIESFVAERQGGKNSDTLNAFLENVALMSDIDALNEENNSITLMTLHASKGLEFPVIFITGLEMDLFPLQRNSADTAELEEERRLLYVGMTRAEENLYLSYAKRRRKYNTYVSSVPSLFLDEIPMDFMELKASKLSAVQSIKTKKQSRRKKMLSYFSDDAESQENETSFDVGSLVYHETFGKGKVTNLEGRGDKAKISVLFEGNISKKLIAQYANLTQLEASD
jgi:DNA helicase II / ATP-dependent DNA helicase PcrA